MRKILFALVCMACTGTAWAQNTTPNPREPAPSVTVLAIKAGTPVQPVSGGRIVAGPACGAPGCNQGCCATKTICVPEPACKITTKINYSSICSHVCFPKCSLFGNSCCNNGCSQADCGHPYQRNYLVKKVCETECPTTKCVPVEVPACDSRGGIIHRYSGPAVVAPLVGEPIAPPKK